MNSIYMIRGGGFGSNFEIKLLMIIITIVAIIYDWRINKRNDYLWIFMTGSLLWFGVELFLQLAGNRIVAKSLLFNRPLPIMISALIRGLSEGSVIAIIGIFFADRFLQHKYRIFWIAVFFILNLLIIILVINQYQPAIYPGGSVPSRRQIFVPAAVIFMITMIIIDVIWYSRADFVSRKRGMFMLAVMIVFGSIWTTSEYLCHTRWIEILTAGSFQHAEFFTEIFVLSYDVIVEIALAYLPFFAIPSLFGMIKK